MENSRVVVVVVILVLDGSNGKNGCRFGRFVVASARRCVTQAACVAQVDNAAASSHGEDEIRGRGKILDMELPGKVFVTAVAVVERQEQE